MSYILLTGFMLQGDRFSMHFPLAVQIVSGCSFTKKVSATIFFSAYDNLRCVSMYMK